MDDKEKKANVNADMTDEQREELMQKLDDRFEIMYNDLKPEIQGELLVFLGVETPEEANIDVFPIAVMER